VTPRRPPARRPRTLDSPVSWHDVPTLSTFLSDRGKIRSRRVTGLPAQQHRQVARAFKTARELALLPHPASQR
jgi:small subunit ribosomal protein S18